MIKMTKHALIPTLILMAAALSACEGLTPRGGNPNPVIAIAADTGLDSVALQDGEAAIAYDPDGCQGWIIDDGVEGYSGRRFDPVSGLPICNSLYPPGTVLPGYQTASAGIEDYVASGAGTGQ